MNIARHIPRSTPLPSHRPVIAPLWLLPRAPMRFRVYRAWRYLIAWLSKELT